MLLLLQAATQQLPPAYVTVQQIASAIPEWAKILVAAGAGAVFAIFGSLTTAYIRRRASRVLRKADVAAEIRNELTRNLDELSDLREIFKVMNAEDAAERAIASELISVFLGHIRRDRYDFFSVSKASLLHDLHYYLDSIYSELDHLRLQIKEPDFRKLESSVESAYSTLQKWLKDHNVEYRGRDGKEIDGIFKSARSLKALGVKDRQIVDLRSELKAQVMAAVSRKLGVLSAQAPASDD
jgi:molecular chaperone GrpE (heat shock protein)